MEIVINCDLILFFWKRLKFYLYVVLLEFGKVLYLSVLDNLELNNK